MARLFQRSRAAFRLASLALLVLAVAGCSSKEERAKSYYENGVKLMAEHDNARASIEFKNAVRIRKDYVEAWLGLAKIAEIDHNWNSVIAILRTVVELNPKDIDSKIKLASLLTAGGATDGALKLVNEATDIDEKNAAALALKALILLRQNDPKGAIQQAQDALKLNPKNFAAMQVLAAERWKNDDSNAALQILDKAETDADGKEISVKLFKLRIFEQTQNWPKAEAILRELAALYPDGGYRNQLIRLYLFEKRPDDAERELRAVIAARPDDPEPELALVRLLSTVKGPAVARQELVARINAGKDVFPYQLALAKLDFVQGNFNDSEQVLKSLISGSPENALTAQLTLAQMYFSRKQLDAADALVSDVLRKDGRNITGLKQRASIRMEQGQLEAAINDLREALNDQPQSSELMLLLAVAYERSGSIDLADKQFADAVRTSNFNPVVSLNYVAFLQRRGSIARAEDVLADLVDRWPQNKQLLSKLAEVKLARHDWAGAEDVAATIKRVGDDTGVADEILGSALLAQNKYEQGVSALQSAYTAAPSAIQPMLSLVRAYVGAKQTDKAVDLLQKALKANPNDAEAYVLLGSIQQATNPNQALISYKSAIEKQPKDAGGYRALAGLYMNQNNLGAAQDVVRIGLKESDSPVLHLMLANILELKEDYEAAIAEYESMLAKAPGSMVVVNNLATLLVDHRTDKASLERAQSLAAALRKSPVPSFKDTLGWVSYRNGDYKAAVPLLEEAAAALPNQALVHYHLGMSYIGIGSPFKALEELNIALKQSPSYELKKEIQAALKKAGS